MRAMSIATVVFVVAGCAQSPRPYVLSPVVHDFCAGHNPASWTQTGTEQLDAADVEFMLQATAWDSSRGANPFKGEFWLASPTGEIRLCRANSGSPGCTWGAWWEFDISQLEPVIVDTGEWICVA